LTEPDRIRLVRTISLAWLIWLEEQVTVQE